MTPPSRPTGSLEEAVRAARSKAVLSTGEILGLGEVGGEDRRTFLQSQLPVDVLAPGGGAFTAYLDRKGRVTHLLTLFDLGERFVFLASPGHLGSLVQKLEEHHFRERVVFADRSAEMAVREIHGPAVPAILAAGGNTRIPPDPYRHVAFFLDGVNVLFLVDPWTGDPGGHLVVERSEVERLERALLAAGAREGLVLAGDEALEVLRIEGGRPRFGADVDERTLLLEIGLPEMVSHDKGCYLGQETVARVHSRGHVNRLLMGIEIEGEKVPAPGTLVFSGDEPAGETRSACASPSLGRPIALAMLRPQTADAGATVHLRLPDRMEAGRVRELPLYRTPGPKEAAAGFYREGQNAFRGDRYAEALVRFERAALLDPTNLDALEAAGICQERLGRYEEAKETMQTLVDADPEHIMAWTNLSRYAAREGNLDEAERIKGKVTALAWKREAGARAAEKKAAEDESARRARLEDRIGIFREVLALDPEDVVANFGLGKIYLDLERWEEAAPRFGKAVETDPTYSAAYDHLGTCLARLGRTAEAMAVLRQGIEAATRRGDLMPKRSMIRKLTELEAGSAAGQ